MKRHIQRFRNFQSLGMFESEMIFDFTKFYIKDDLKRNKKRQKYLRIFWDQDLKMLEEEMILSK